MRPLLNTLKLYWFDVFMLTLITRGHLKMLFAFEGKPHLF